MYEHEVQVAERIPDISDRASVEEQAFTDDRIAMQRRIMEKTIPTARADGLCACGCGEDVEPQRLKLNLGLALDCAIRREKAR
jgi:hypothetical protein